MLKVQASRIVIQTMPFPNSKNIFRPITFLMLLLAVQCAAVETPTVLAAESFEASLERLRSVSSGPASQAQIKGAWDRVVSGGVDRLITVLEAMSPKTTAKISPLAENWLRASADAIAEHELQSSGKLPADALERFVLDSTQAPRARRTAFEWLNQVDPSASGRLLPSMLDDSSLEIRHDAVARLLAEAEQAVNDTDKLKKYQRAFQSARSLEQMKQCLQQLQQLGETPNLAAEFGYLTTWKTIGPFDNTAGAGFDKNFPPETEVDFAKQYEGKHGPVKWLNLNTEAQNQDLERVGVVDLNEILAEEKGVVAYVAAQFNSATEQVLECRYGTVNATKLWVNGELLISKNVYHMGGEFDQYIGSIRFRKGKNTILLKICQNEQTENWARDWNFRLRVTDRLGGGIAQVTVSE